MGIFQCLIFFRFDGKFNMSKEVVVRSAFKLGLINCIFFLFNSLNYIYRIYIWKGFNFLPGSFKNIKTRKSDFLDICNINGCPVFTKENIITFWVVPNWFCNTKLYMLDGILVTYACNKLVNCTSATTPLFIFNFLLG